MSNVVYITPANLVDLTGEGDRRADSLFDAMLEAQDDLGQITWTVVTWNIAIGFYLDGTTSDNRVAVFDLGTANGLEVIRTTNWVNGHGTFPEITK